MKRTPICRQTKKMREILQKNKEEKMEEFNLYQEIWKERPHKSEVTGSSLGREARTYMFHHILPKSKYPEHRLNKDNIILLTFEEHEKVEKDPQCYEEVNKRRQNLLNP